MTDRAAALVGRDRELEIVTSFLGHAMVDGGALLLTGEPGVGKTMLLEAAAEEAASRMTVLRTAGAETQANFGALGQLLEPVLELDRLSDLYRGALNAALGRGDESQADSLVLPNAVLTLLLHAARIRPVLLVVDDLPWIDRPSALALGLVARRLAGTRIGFLAAARSGDEGFFERSGLPADEVRSLDETAAADLLRGRFPALAPGARARVLAEARGNPLALLELPTALSEAQQTVTRPLPPVLPLTERLTAVFAARVGGLPATTQRLLLLAALDGTGELAILRAAAGPGGLDGLGPAERAGVVQQAGSPPRLAFRHPLTRAAVVALAGDSERRQAHQALAEVTKDEPERRAWHLAAAATGPDEQAAGQLEQAAQLILRRGDGTGAVAALLRASDLSPEGPDRARRIAAAAYVGANMVGDLRSVPGLLEDARRADPDFGQSPQIAMAAAYRLLNEDGDIDTAHRLLVSAIEDQTSRLRQDGSSATAAGSGSADDILVEALYSLALVCFFGGRAELWPPFEAALERLGHRAPEALTLQGRTFRDPVRTAVPALGELEAAVRGLTGEVNPAQTVRIAIAADYVDRLAGCEDALRRVVRDGVAGEAVALAIEALLLLFVDAFQSGQWDEAQRLAERGVELCDTHGYRVFAWTGQWGRAMLAAARGDYGTTSALTDEITGWATPRRLLSVHAYAANARALAALGRGDFEEAYAQAAAISPPGVLPPYAPHALWVILDLVEAAVRTGRTGPAAAHVKATRDAEVGAISPRLALVTTATAALVAPPGQAAAEFTAALAVPGADRAPFEQARVRLLYGEWLRRNQSNAEARAQLSAARNVFGRLGARPWQERAESELRAAG